MVKKKESMFANEDDCTKPSMSTLNWGPANLRTKFQHDRRLGLNNVSYPSFSSLSSVFEKQCCRHAKDIEGKQMLSGY